MNWTGGRLQRSRHAGTSLAALQKNHFAKARTRLQNGPPTASLFKVPVFEIAKDQGQRLPDYQSLLASEVRKNRTQSTLEDCHNTAHIAKRLKSIKGRRSYDKTRPLRFHGQRHGSRISSHNDDLARHLRAVTTKVDSDPNGLYGMTHGHSAEQSLEAKRLELLQRQDWVGARILKPLKKELVEDDSVERIGKRRRLREYEYELHRGMRYRTPVPAINERSQVDSRRPPPYHLHHDAISVRLGTSIHGSQRTREEKDLPSQRSRQSEFSDSMLLDAEDVAQPHYHSTWVPTPSRLEKDFTADTPSCLATNTGRAVLQQIILPLSSPVGKRNDRMAHPPSLPLACSRPRNAAVTSENIDATNSVAGVSEVAAPQNNSRPYSDRKAGSGEAFDRLVFTSSPRPKHSSIPSATLEVASRTDTRDYGNISIALPNSELKNGAYDASWKKYLDISGSSVEDQNIDTSPLSKATSRDLAALWNDTKGETAQALAASEEEKSVNDNSLPRASTAYRDEDSVWRSFVFGDERDADSSTTYEQIVREDDFIRSRNQPSASSQITQASSEDVEAAIGTSSARADSPSSISYLVPALPRMVESSSPDPLNHLKNSTRFVDPKQMRRVPGHKLLFTKPVRFVARRPTANGSTFRIGERLDNIERLDDDGIAAAYKERRPVTTNRRRFEMTWESLGPAYVEEIIDN